MAGKARQQRIGAEIQRVLSELISREVKDPRVGTVTLTAVKLSPDASVAQERKTKKPTREIKTK